MTFDLCEGCSNHLSESEQAEFKQATAPTSSHDAEIEATGATAEQEAARAAAEPFYDVSVSRGSVQVR